MADQIHINNSITNDRLDAKVQARNKLAEIKNKMKDMDCKIVKHPTSPRAVIIKYKSKSESNGKNKR